MILLQAAGTGMTSLIMFGMIFLVMYLFMIKPQIRKQKQEHKYRLGLQKGDKVVTIGGIHGRIIDVKDTTCTIEIHSGNILKIEKNAVSMTGDVGLEKK